MRLNKCELVHGLSSYCKSILNGWAIYEATRALRTGK